jgi:poly(hydroxyalkanoate) depolymerase family esterase
MLHGCTQTPAGLARSSRMNELADAHGFYVAYPQQTAQHNQQACWNWFLARHQGRTSGEPAILAGITREVLAAPRIDSARVFVAGLSAGASMAAILAATHPDVFAAVGIHSGLAYRSATTQEAAFEAMARGSQDPTTRGREAFRAMGAHARPVPAIVVHGTGDPVVSPANGEAVVRQWLSTNALAAGDGLGPSFEDPDTVVHGQVDGGHPYTRVRWADGNGRVLQEFIRVAGLGHAWSGGAHKAGWTDARGPDASAAMWGFFEEVAGTTGRR